MTLCHYPMMSWPDSTTTYMIFGHIHNNTNADYWPLIEMNPLMMNAGVDINGFKPVTFDEMMEKGYSQAVAGEGVELGAAFDELRKGTLHGIQG